MKLTISGVIAYLLDKESINLWYINTGKLQYLWIWVFRNIFYFIFIPVWIELIFNL